MTSILGETITTDDTGRTRETGGERKMILIEREDLDEDHIRDPGHGHGHVHGLVAIDIGAGHRAQIGVAVTAEALV